jgi:hypothetical protein
MPDTALVITSIAPPGNAVLQTYAAQCRQRGIEFILIGDAASPLGFALEGCRFYGLDEQRALPFKLAKLLPVRHYARKNLGYLLARNCRLILETDDDNLPLENYWQPRRAETRGFFLADAGWTNVYRYFTDAHIWPRGFPLTRLPDAVPDLSNSTETTAYSPIQHGLSDGQPDVDAIFRLVYNVASLKFRDHAPVLLGAGAWCPFNSQNTAWFRAAFPLLYLPATCTFRMTDIWRSFVAQRVAWTCGWPVMFHAPNVRQERNPHDALRDFADEVPGYLHNARICALLTDLPLRDGVENISANLLACYEALAGEKFVDDAELPLVEAWLADLAC